jgi:putative oxidoreductase
MSTQTLTLTEKLGRTHIMARAAHAHWLLRAGFASVFLFHGVGKFADLDGFAGMMGLPVFIAILVGLAEVGGGLALIAGGFLRSDMLTRLGALATIPVLIGAIALVHWGQWSFVASETHPMGGMEFQVVLLMIALFFLIAGKGESR